MLIAMVIYYDFKLTIIPYQDNFGDRYVETDDNDLLNIEHGCCIESFFDDYDSEDEEDDREICKAWIHYCYNEPDEDDIDLTDLRDYFSDYLNVHHTNNSCQRIKLT